MLLSVSLLVSIVTYTPGANAKAATELAAKNAIAIFIQSGSFCFGGL